MTTATLFQAQEKLGHASVCDVKFMFKRESLAVPMSDLKEDVSVVVYGFLNGKKKVVDQLPSEELSSVE